MLCRNIQLHIKSYIFFLLECGQRGSANINCCNNTSSVPKWACTGTTTCFVPSYFCSSDCHHNKSMFILYIILLLILYILIMFLLFIRLSMPMEKHGRNKFQMFQSLPLIQHIVRCNSNKNSQVLLQMEIKKLQ